MISPVAALHTATSGISIPRPGSGNPSEGATGSFASELAGAIARVEQDARVSGELRDRLLRGENVELHTVAIHSQQAQLSFELLLQVRNKLIQGYQEIMRMQI